MNDLTRTDHEMANNPALAPIFALQRMLAQLPQIDMPVLHNFSKGVYARTIFIPAGTVATGKIHRTEHLMILVQGHLLIQTEHGMSEKEGFQIWNSTPGLKRAVRTFTDTILTTIHVTDKTDLDDIEAELIIPEPSPFIEGEML